MADKTTIQLTGERKDQLDALKRADGESYDSVLARLINSHTTEHEPPLTEPDVRAIVRDELDSVSAEQ